MIAFLKALYLNRRIYFILFLIGSTFIVGAYVPAFFYAAQAFLAAFLVALIYDVWILFRAGDCAADRDLPDMLSNGDENLIKIYLKSNYKRKINFEIIDEIPVQFQKRDFLIRKTLDPGERREFEYTVRPVKRGEYSFGETNFFAETPLGLAKRRFRFDNRQETKVYPSFLKMRRYEMMAISNRLTDLGVKKIRKIGATLEFEQINNYVVGDDIRLINWKATARKNELMVNRYSDERSQHVYNVIDSGRSMKAPFEQMTLLDYAVNSSLILSDISLHKHDKPGLITFGKEIDSFVPSDNKRNQMQLIMETLYKHETDFLEPNYPLLYLTLRRRLKQRSLILLYTNFESLGGMRRNLQYLRSISKYHLLVVVFFQNTELYKILNDYSENLKEIYAKVVAENYAFEKSSIVKELRKYGIPAVFTEPKNLTANTINKYLEIKARRLL